MNLLAVNLFLAVGWAALVGSFTATSLAVGYFIGFGCLWVARPLFGDDAYFKRVYRALRLIVLFIYELVVSSFRVAWDVITPSHLSSPGIVAMPLDAKTDTEVYLTASLITLTPGTLSLDVSPDRKTLYVHGMFIDDPETLKTEMKQGLERAVLQALE